MPHRINALVRCLRPRQWLKNSFVLVALMFVNERTSADYLNTALVFVAFCLVASSVYILNDICDIATDQSDPLKGKRPIASGAISINAATMIGTLLLGGAFLAALSVSIPAASIIGTYYFVNVGYSLGLKRIAPLDAFIIAFGFMLRILIGSVAISAPPSRWLLLTGLMLTLFLAFCKRRAEARYEAQQAITVTAACTIIAYALYTVAEDTVTYHQTYGLFFTVPIVAYGVLRYSTLAGADAADHLTTDPHLIITGVLWLGSTLALLYWR